MPFRRCVRMRRRSITARVNKALVISRRDRERDGGGRRGTREKGGGETPKLRCSPFPGHPYLVISSVSEFCVFFFFVRLIAA
jgi:hypothetical protein